MKRFWPCLLLCLTFACGGNGGGGTPFIDPAPVISNLTLNPSSVVRDAGGGTVPTECAFDFRDSDGDVTTLRLLWGTESQDITISGASGQTSGVIYSDLLMNTAIIGNISFQFQIIDAKGHNSNILSATFHITHPAPVISSISPLTAVTGGPSFTLTLNGKDFLHDSKVLWNGDPRPTTFISSSKLQVTITAEDIASQGSAQIYAKNADTEGGASASLTFTISNIQTLVVNATANDIIWDPARKVIYASIPSTAESNSNSILVIDPITGIITTAVSAGSEPNRLAISEDSQFLYVGLDGAAKVQRFNLPSLTTDITIPLGSDPFYGPYFAQDIQVAPESPHTIAVSLGTGGASPSAQGGVVVFDEGAPRTNKVPGGTDRIDSLQWGSDATQLYGANCESSSYDFYILAVDSNGASLVKNIPGAFTWFPNDIHFDKSTGYIYSDSGQVWSSVTERPIGLFRTSGAMTHDLSQNMAFFGKDTYEGDYLFQSFKLTEFTSIGSASIVPVTPSYLLHLPSPNRLFRWGNNGLVFGGRGNLIYIISGPFVLGQKTTTPLQQTPAVSSISPLSAVAGGPAFLLIVNGSGFVSGSTVQWNGDPRPTTYISSNQIRAAIAAQDITATGSALVTVMNPTGSISTHTSQFSIGNIQTTVVSIPTNDIVCDPTRNVIYASLPSAAGSNGNSIAVIDPTTGNIESTIFAGSEPNKLAISDDGQFLYVGMDGEGAIQRFILPSLTKDISIPLGTDPFDGPYSAKDIQVAPATPRTIAVSLCVRGYVTGGVFIFDDATPRTNTIADSSYSFSSLQWGADAMKLYGANGENTNFDFYILAVDSNGVRLDQEIPNTFRLFGNTIHFDKLTGNIYSDSGEVLIPTTGQSTGAFLDYGPMTPDSSQTMAFFLSGADSTNALILKSFNLNGFAGIGSASLLPDMLAISQPTPNRLFRWGNNGLAFGGRNNFLYLVTGPFVSGQ